MVDVRYRSGATGVTEDFESADLDAHLWVVGGADTAWVDDIELGAGATIVFPDAVPGTLTGTPGFAQAALEWQPVGGATAYNIYWAEGTTVTTADNVVTVAPDTAGPTYIKTGLANGLTYAFAVAAVNSRTESALSNIVTVTPDAAGPPSEDFEGGFVPAGDPLLQVRALGPNTIVPNGAVGSAAFDIGTRTVSDVTFLIENVGLSDIMVFDAAGSRCVVSGDATLVSDAAGVTEPMRSTSCKLDAATGRG